MIMNKKFVLASFDLTSEWEGTSPSFRVYVNKELFCERKFSWHSNTIRISLQIEAPPGSYPVEVVAIRNPTTSLSTSNHAIKVGPGSWLGSNKLEIQ